MKNFSKSFWLVVSTMSLIFYLFVYVSGASQFLLFGNKELLDLSLNAGEFIEKFTGPDVVYQIRFAYIYYTEARVDEWVLSLWPPGMSLINLAFFNVFGLENYPWKFLIFSCVLYGLMSYSIYYNLLKNFRALYSVVLMTLPLFYMSFREPLFSGIGFFSSDYFSFIGVGFFLPILLSGNIDYKRALVAGFGLGVLAYLRSYYYLMASMLTGVFFIVFFIVLINCLKKSNAIKLCHFFKSKFLRVSLVFFGGVWALLIPFKLILFFRGIKHSWTATDQAWAAQWRFDLPEFLSGMNTPCIINKSLCEHLLPFQLQDTWATPLLGATFYKWLSLATFLQNPLMWICEKLNYFHIFWFDGKKITMLSGFYDWIQFSVSFLLLCAIAFIVCKTIFDFVKAYYLSTPIAPGLTSNIVFSLFIFFNCFVFVFVHFESRYSVPIKWVTILYVLYLINNSHRIKYS